jgi:transposase
LTAIVALNMIRNMSKIGLRRLATEAVRDGASITATARRYEISRATLHRWLRAFDPEHPVGSLRPKKTGPKGPRWTDEMLQQTERLIADHPHWWGKGRVATALRERGVTLSEATVSRMLAVARQQLAQERNRDAREQEVRFRRQARTALRRSEREAARAATRHDLLVPAQEPGLTPQERGRRIAQALESKGYKIQVKDLTPELRAIADEYIENLGWRDDAFSPRDEWLIDARHWLLRWKNPAAASSEQMLRRGPNIDDLRVGALNHLVKNFGRSLELAPPHVLLA